ncbi:hypothetical protein GCM10009716_01590 [Streptomyces sodiiphilus]|uniref:N-acetyltransferase domain-containing protein n=1 Tax=Streptomyces sodiiphilus TaxID=226217 RepID=A0ABP5A054_9ACTN
MRLCGWSPPGHFAWLCDVCLDRSASGLGLGEHLVRAVLEELGEDGPRPVMLATADAHGLYRNAGFRPVREHGKWMIRGAE